MKLLSVIGVLAILVLIGGAAYAYLGYYNVAATEPHLDLTRQFIASVMENSVERHAGEEVRRIPALDDGDMIGIGAEHFGKEHCVTCHGAPGVAPAEFAEHMRPQPPDLAKAVKDLSDAELFWIMKHGIKMTAMPAFGPTHREDELWAMVAFVRRLPEMPEAKFKRLSGFADSADRASENAGDHGKSEHHH